MGGIFKQSKENIFTRTAVITIVFVQVFSLVFAPVAVQAQSVLTPSARLLNLPSVGTMVTVSPSFVPPLINGLTIYPDDPLLFDFIVNSGEDDLEGDELVVEANKMIKYFLAALTVPEDELWVNLSPYEADRIIPEQLGLTDMGRDMLAQDYLLKQLMASLLYPENDLGKKFWDRVYARAYEEYGTTEIPMNTFNKVWIVPDKVTVLEKDNTAYVLEAKLKVMLEEDYVALENNMDVRKGAKSPSPAENNFQTQIIKNIIIPEIEKEVNTGKAFANLRQIYNAMILATWYKINLKETLLSQVYVNRNKIKGVEGVDKEIKEKIYNQYIEAFSKGVYNYIKEDYDSVTKEIIPRKYFSGGEEFTTFLGNALRKGTLIVGPDISQGQAGSFIERQWLPGTQDKSFAVQLFEYSEDVNQLLSSAKEGDPLVLRKKSTSSPMILLEKATTTLQFIFKEKAGVVIALANNMIQVKEEEFDLEDILSEFEKLKGTFFQDTVSFEEDIHSRFDSRVVTEVFMKLARFIELRNAPEEKRPMIVQSIMEYLEAKDRVSNGGIPDAHVSLITAADVFIRQRRNVEVNDATIKSWFDQFKLNPDPSVLGKLAIDETDNFYFAESLEALALEINFFGIEGQMGRGRLIDKIQAYVTSSSPATTQVDSVYNQQRNQELVSSSSVLTDEMRNVLQNVRNRMQERFNFYDFNQEALNSAHEEFYQIFEKAVSFDGYVDSNLFVEEHIQSSILEGSVEEIKSLLSIMLNSNFDMNSRFYFLGYLERIFSDIFRKSNASIKRLFVKPQRVKDIYRVFEELKRKNPLFLLYLWDMANDFELESVKDLEYIDLLEKNHLLQKDGALRDFVKQVVKVSLDVTQSADEIDLISLEEVVALYLSGVDRSGQSLFPKVEESGLSFSSSPVASKKEPKRGSVFSFEKRSDRKQRIQELLNKFGLDIQKMADEEDVSFSVMYNVVDSIAKEEYEPFWTKEIEQLVGEIKIILKDNLTQKIDEFQYGKDISPVIVDELVEEFLIWIDQVAKIIKTQNVKIMHPFLSALKVIKMRLSGDSYEVIAEEMNLSKDVLVKSVRPLRSSMVWWNMEANLKFTAKMSPTLVHILRGVGKKHLSEELGNYLWEVTLPSPEKVAEALYEIKNKRILPKSIKEEILSSSPIEGDSKKFSSVEYEGKFTGEIGNDHIVRKFPKKWNLRDVSEVYLRTVSDEGVLYIEGYLSAAYEKLEPDDQKNLTMVTVEHPKKGWAGSFILPQKFREELDLQGKRELSFKVNQGYFEIKKVVNLLKGWGGFLPSDIKLNDRKKDSTSSPVKLDPRVKEKKASSPVRDILSTMKAQENFLKKRLESGKGSYLDQRRAAEVEIADESKEEISLKEVFLKLVKQEGFEGSFETDVKSDYKSPKSAFYHHPNVKIKGRGRSKMARKQSDLKSSSSPVGGIDFNPELMNLQIIRDGNGVALPVSQQPIHSMNIEGFVPVIINVTPINSLPLLLGLEISDVQDESIDSISFNLSSSSPINRIDRFVLNREEYSTLS